MLETWIFAPPYCSMDSSPSGNGLYFSGLISFARRAISLMSMIFPEMLDAAKGLSAAECLWLPTTRCIYVQVKWKDLLTGIWNDPDSVLIWGRGHVCVFPQDAEGAWWLPE